MIELDDDDGPELVFHAQNGLHFYIVFIKYYLGNNEQHANNDDDIWLDND